MYGIEYKGIIIKTVKGDITEQDTDAVVNAANKRLSPGGGVAGAIHYAAGSGLWEECKKIGICETGEAVITKGYKLPAKWVIHTVGPVWANRHEDPQMLYSCYVNSLAVADKNNVRSISFPAISTGAFGYPLEEGAEIAIKAVSEIAEKLSSVKLIQFVLYDDRAYSVFENKLRNLERNNQDSSRG
ncbi:O-acetyl-ADP-ribose deacetylase [candidate division WOR-3 bacterium]|nr:O-acetyl-ADP-ribose deacetylase [candidate division WOR-3 bacterium]